MISLTSFKEYLLENTIHKHNGFSIVDRTGNKITTEMLEALKSMIDLSVGYLKIKPTTIYIEKRSNSSESFGSANIRYDKNIDEMVKDLAHELVHVAQRQHGDMKDTGEIGDYDYVLWKGKRMKIYTRGDSYKQSPWEIDARDREQKIFTMWKRFNK